MTLTLNFQGQIWNLLYLPQMIRLPRNKKQTYRLNSKPQMWPSDLTLAMTLTLNFQGQICCVSAKNCPIASKQKPNISIELLSFECDHRIWPWPWPWIFKVKYEIHYILAQKWSDCHEINSKHVNWILCLKCNHRIWPWLWPWPWIFKVRHGIFFISATNGPIATKQKTYILIEP